ncbi:MAG: hypothetical protein J2P46_04485 [Zavarzinella sp.]|nr:hypothetical protein [Zavarzinella sp.]
MAIITYETLIKYLDAIDLNGTLSASGAPHGVFWKDARGNNLPLATFKSLAISVPNGPVKLFNEAQYDQSPLYLILLGPWNGRPQMPKRGPYITDPGYSVTVDGNAVSGTQIQADILDWLKLEFPPPAAGS